VIFCILRRLLAAIPTLLAELTRVFVINRIVPGDPAMVILGDQATPAGIAAIHARLDLDKRPGRNMRSVSSLAARRTRLPEGASRLGAALVS
jgi:ABC-type dipeptide/oligopeptide/nickel transport system permease component